MNPMLTGLTLEEQERWAYANGDHGHARLLAVAVDALDELTRIEFTMSEDAERDGDA